MAIKRKVRRKLDKRTQRLSVRRSNRQLYRMIQVMSIIGTLVIANVLFTMVTKHISGHRRMILNSKVSSPLWIRKWKPKEERSMIVITRSLPGSGCLEPSWLILDERRRSMKR